MPNQNLFISIRIIKGKKHDSTNTIAKQLQNDKAEFIDDHELSDCVLMLTPELKKLLISLT